MKSRMLDLVGINRRNPDLSGDSEQYAYYLLGYFRISIRRVAENSSAVSV